MQQSTPRRVKQNAIATLDSYGTAPKLPASPQTQIALVTREVMPLGTLSYKEWSVCVLRGKLGTLQELLA